MKLTTTHLIANPCDEEEEAMALLCCHGAAGEMFLMTRFPDEDEVEITLGDDPHLLTGLKVTLVSGVLSLEVQPADKAVFDGEAVLEIHHDTPDSDLAEVEEALRNLLVGIGTLNGEAL